MKPAPPDDKRIEFILADNSPETQRTAREAAKVLAAGQMIRPIQERIEKCREQIFKVTQIIVKCKTHRAYAENRNMVDKYVPLGPKEHRKYASEDDRHRIYDEQLLRVAPPEDMPVYIEIMTKINSVAMRINGIYFDEIPNYPGSNSLVKTMIDCHEQIASLLTGNLSKLQTELAELETRLRTLMDIVTN